MIIQKSLIDTKGGNYVIGTYVMAEHSKQKEQGKRPAIPEIHGDKLGQKHRGQDIANRTGDAPGTLFGYDLTTGWTLPIK